MYDSIVIGAGAAGSVMARELAERLNHRVLIIEQREHIGGNCYDENDQYGILIHKYGPHIFHTNNDRVYQYLSRFTSWFGYNHQVAASIYGTEIPVPFNLNTLHQIFDDSKANSLEQKLIASYGKDARVSILDLRKNEDIQIQEVADYVYNNIFLTYTMKQWGQTPDEIDPSVLSRVPVLLSYDNRYFQDKYQGLPLEGYTSLFTNMLDHPNITVALNTQAKEVLTILENEILYNGNTFNGPIIYTGAIDELYKYCYGQLPYRSLDFQFEHYDMDQFQSHGVVNYTVDEAYTRITEFKHMTGQVHEGTTIVKEYPEAFTGAAGQIPYYAIMNKQNKEQYHKYELLTTGLKDFHLLGRLAQYQYYNIDAMVEQALQLADSIIKKHQ